MMPSDEYFTPERVDEQIEHLQHPGMLDEVTDEMHLVKMLEQSYQMSLDAEDRAALAHVRQRVLDKQREPVINAGAVPVTTPAFGSVTRPPRRHLPQIVSSLAAVILVGVLLGSWFEVTHVLGKPSPTLSPLAASQSSGNLYIVLSGVAYGFDGRSGKVLWQHRLSTPNPSGSADVKVVNGVDYVILNAELYALDASNGKQLWHLTNPDGKDYFWDVIAGGRVYLFSLDYTFSALSATNGSQLWHNTAFTTESGYGFSVIDGSLYTQNSVSDQKLYSLDGTTGQVRWNISLTQGSLTSNLLVENGVLYFSAGNLCYAVKEQSGEKIWEQAIPGGGFGLSLSNNILYVNSPAAVFDVGTRSPRDSGTIYALNARTGQKVWISADGYSTLNAPLTQNLLLAERQHNGVSSIVGLNPQTGSVIWQEPLGPSGDASTWSAEWTDVIDGELYLLEGSSDPSAYTLKSLNPANGHLLSAQSLTVQQGSPSVIGVSHGRLYLQITVPKTANGIPYADFLLAVYRLDTGSPVWSYAMPPFPPPKSANTTPNTSQPVLAP